MLVAVVLDRCQHLIVSVFLAFSHCSGHALVSDLGLIFISSSTKVVELIFPLCVFNGHS